MIKYIVFDLCGVIVEKGSIPAYDKIGSLLNLTKEQIREYLAESSLTGGAYRKSEITKEIFWQKALSGWGKNYDWEVLNDIWLKGYKLKTDVYRIVQELYKNNYKLGVLSNTVEDRFHYIDKQANLTKYFSAMVISYKDRILKPDKKAFELIIERLGVKDSYKVVYIDDKEIHAQVAKSLGMQALVFSNASQLEADLRKLGVKI